MTRPQPTSRPRVLPLGGAVEVARSYLALHVRNPWTGRCRSCGDAYPCRDRRDAETVAGRPESKPRKATWLLALPVLLGVALVAVAATGLVRW